MRPARKGPENVVSQSQSSFSPASFNEAGPQGAGKRTTCFDLPVPASSLQ